MCCVSVKPWLHSDTPTWVPFSWTQWMLEVWRQSGTLLKEQGSHELDIRLWGIKGVSKRRTCVRMDRAQTHLLLYTLYSYS